MRTAYSLEESYDEISRKNEEREYDKRYEEILRERDNKKTGEPEHPEPSIPPDVMDQINRKIDVIFSEFTRRMIVNQGNPEYTVDQAFNEIAFENRSLRTGDKTT